MTYPTVERKIQIKSDRESMLRKEADLFLEAESIEEFYLKRDIAGIQHNLWNDIFKVYYHVRDKFQHIASDYDEIQLTLTVFGIISGCIAACSLLSEFYGFGIPVTILFLGDVVSGILLLKVSNMYDKARVALDGAEDRMNLKNKRSENHLTSNLFSSSFTTSNQLSS